MVAFLLLFSQNEVALKLKQIIAEQPDFIGFFNTVVKWNSTHQ